jgi:hypothetical protein
MYTHLLILTPMLEMWSEGVADTKKPSASRTSTPVSFGLRCTLGEEANYGFIVSTAHPPGSHKRKVFCDFTPT